MVLSWGFVADPLARSTAVWRKSFVFSSLPIRKGLVCFLRGALAPPLSVVSLLFSASYPQDRRSYYLFFNYLFFTICMVYLYRRKLLPRVYLYRRKTAPKGVPV